MTVYRRYSAATNKFMKVTENELFLNSCMGAQLYLSIDCSSTNTGMAVIDDGSNSLIGTIAVGREDGEDYIAYRLRLKEVLKRFMEGNVRVLKQIYYEEPFIGYASAAEVLYALKITVKEIILENAPRFDKIAFLEVSNKKWKKIFLSPEKVAGNTDVEKKQVQRKIMQMFGSCVMRGEYDKKTKQVADVLIFTEDECDAIGLGIACKKVRKTGIDDEELLSKKPVRPFKYNVEFEVMPNTEYEDADAWVYENFSTIIQKYKIPDIVVDNGVKIERLKGTGNFEKHVMNTMGNNDMLVILEYNAAKYTDALIKNGRSDLCSIGYTKEDLMLAFIWRKSRKAR